MLSILLLGGLKILSRLGFVCIEVKNAPIETLTNGIVFKRGMMLVTLELGWTVLPPWSCIISTTSSIIRRCSLSKQTWVRPMVDQVEGELHHERQEGSPPAKDDDDMYVSATALWQIDAFTRRIIKPCLTPSWGARNRSRYSLCLKAKGMLVNFSVGPHRPALLIALSRTWSTQNVRQKGKIVLFSHCGRNML